MNQTEKVLITITKVCVLLIPLTLLVVASPLLFPYITGKALLFRALIEIAALCLSFILISHPELMPAWPFKKGLAREKKEYIFWSSVALVLALFFVNIFSVRPLLSFFGNAERMEGTWSLFHFFLYFWVLYFLFKIESKFKQSLFWSIALTSFLISLQEIYQKFSLHISRPFATLGNADYIGFFSLLVIFLCFYFYREEKSKSGKIVISLLALANLGAMIASETRGSILALGAAGIFLIIALISISIKDKRRKLAFFGLVIIFVVGFYGLVKSPIAEHLPGINRLHTTLQSNSSYIARLIAWQIFLRASLVHPIAGYGLENEPIAYFDKFEPKIFNYEQVIFDRPHNKYIEILVTTGLIGTIFYLIFYGSILTDLLTEDDKTKKYILISLFLAYLFDNFILFDMQASYLLFFFGLALIARPVQLEKPKTNEHQLSLKILISGLVGLGLLFNIYNVYILSRIIANLKLPPEEALANYDQLANYAGPYLEEEAIIVSNYFKGNIKNINNLAELNLIKDVFRKAYARDPYDIRIVSNYATFLGQMVDVEKANHLPDQADLNQAKIVFEQAVKQFNHFPDLYLNYAIFLHQTNNDARAYQLTVETEKYYKNYPGGLVLTAEVMSLLNKNKEALALVEQAEAKGYQPSQNLQTGLITLRVYIENKKINQANQLLRQLLKNNPDPKTQAAIIQVVKTFVNATSSQK